MLASCSYITTSSSSLDLEAKLSWVTVYAALVIFSAWDSLAFSALESFRTCCTLAKDLTIADRVIFSSDSACCAAASCAARAVSQYCQELVKIVKWTEVTKEQRGYLPDQLLDSLSPLGSQ
jgi:hypothetical protein